MANHEENQTTEKAAKRAAASSSASPRVTRSRTKCPRGTREELTKKTVPELKSLLAEKCLNTKGKAKRALIDRLVEAENGGNAETFTAGSEGAQSASSGEATITEHLDEGILQKYKPRLHIGVVITLRDAPERSVPEVFKDAAVTVTDIDREQNEIEFIACGKRQSWPINATETVGAKPFSVEPSLQ